MRKNWVSFLPSWSMKSIAPQSYLLFLLSFLSLLISFALWTVLVLRADYDPCRNTSVVDEYCVPPASNTSCTHGPPGTFKCVCNNGFTSSYNLPRCLGIMAFICKLILYYFQHYQFIHAETDCIYLFFWTTIRPLILMASLSFRRKNDRHSWLSHTPSVHWEIAMCLSSITRRG